MSLLDIPAIRASTPLSSVVAQHVKLTRAGQWFRGSCPFHSDSTPSFWVNDEMGRYGCFGCPESGDVLDFIQAIERVGLREAAERLSALPVVPRERRAPPEDRSSEARQIWRQAAPIVGTPAETYLRSRGLWGALPESLRFARLHYGKRGPLHPCLVALVASIDNRLLGIQRTFLNDAGTGKASVPKPKLSLGRIRGGAIRLAPAAAELVVCEGLEDGLTLQQELGAATWVAAGVGNLMTLELPADVRSVIIGADRDAAGEAGARTAADRFAGEGRKVRIIRPLDGHKDFNAELQATVA